MMEHQGLMAAWEKFSINRFKRLASYVLVAIFYILPQFWVRGFNLIDDPGKFALAMKSPLNILADSFQSKEHFYPTLELFWSLRAIFFGSNVHLWFVIHAFILAGTLFLLSLIYQRLSLPNKIVWVLPLFLLIFPTTATNYYRLGTTEPLHVFFLLLFFYGLLCHWNLFYLEIVLLLLVTMNEKSIFYVPALILFSLAQRSIATSIALAVTGSAFFLYYLLIRLPQREGYALLFSLDSNMFVVHLLAYIQAYPDVFFIVGAALLLCLLFMSMRVSLWRIAIFALPFLALVPVLFWALIQEYYLYPMVVCTLLAFSVIVFPPLMTLMSKQSRVKKIFVVILLFLFFSWPVTRLLIRSRDVALWWHKEHLLNGRLTEYLFTHSFTRVFADVGVTQEMGDHIYLLTTHYRKDNVEFYPDNVTWMTLPPFDSERLTYYNEQSRNLFCLSRRGVLITQQSNGFSPDEFFIQSFCAKSPFSSYDCKWYIIAPLVL